MATKRMLSKDVCISDKISGLTWFQEVLYYRVLVSSDDYGCFYSREPIIKEMCFPGKQCSLKAISNGIKALEKAGLVELKVFNKRSLLEVKDWFRYQNLRVDRQKHSFFGMTTDIPSDIPPVIPEAKAKAYVLGLGLGRGTPSEDFLLNRWAQCNPDFLKTNPKMRGHAATAIKAALKRGYTAPEIEKILVDTAGQAIPPWQLFPVKERDLKKEWLEKEAKNDAS